MNPYFAQGTVFGTLLNHRQALAALGDQVYQPTYKAPPRAPILYIKPRNTWRQHGEPVVVPADANALEIGASLGIVIGRTASNLKFDDAMSCVAGYTIVNDISIAHESFYRPSIRYKCRDGFCPIGPAMLQPEAIQNPDDLKVVVSIDGSVVHETTTSDRIRSVRQLLVDVTEFMTLHPGDVLSIGVAAGAPMAKAGQLVKIEIEGLGLLENKLVAEELL
jgi:5-oxopent-3-ene-1,2,5-tricarboxylate decarboxylase/2-hydroxyhepta-2,4-diene-1,7-dioate isomerase